jgi:hypothetical protein
MRYGRPAQSTNPAEQDPRLDELMPRYDVVERHHIRVAAPAATTMAAARALDLSGVPLARAIFTVREIIMGSQGAAQPESRGFVADMQALGWGLLAEDVERGVIMGGVTKPWEADPVFRAVPPERFATFDEPGYVKIAFTLRVESTGETASVFRTETRALATDADARARFRWYWALLSPGIIAVRWALLRPVKCEAQRRARGADDGAAATSI